MNTLKNVVARFVNNLCMDLFPQSAAEMVDFGFNYATDKTELFRAYRTGLLSNTFTADDLNAAVGDGEMLTALVAKVSPSLKVTTDYDFF